MKKEHEFGYPERSYPNPTRYYVLALLLPCCLLLYSLMTFQEDLYGQQAHLIDLVVFAVTMFLIFAALAYLSSRQHNALRHHLMIMANSIDKPFVATDQTGKILFKNEHFTHGFAHIKSQIEEFTPYINNKHAQEDLYQYLKSAIKEETFDTVLDIGMHDKSIKSFYVSCRRKKDLLLWTLLEEDLLKETYLFYGNDFQKSINPKDLFHQTPTGNVILDQDGCVQGYNTAFKKLLPNHSIILGMPFKDLLSSACQFDLNFDVLRVLNNHNQLVPIEFEFEQGKVALGYFNKIEFPDLSLDLSHKGYVLQLFDNNEHRKFQQRLSQSQKLQALGQLAGGIAHDFNNLLTAMMGYCDLLLLRHSPGEQSFTEIMQIKQNATRAGNLIKQLLAFSRKQTLQPTIIDVSETLADLFSMLKRLIGSSIDFKVTHGRDLDCIKADRGQFEQVITNLIVNARDAIQESGAIHLITSNRAITHPTTIGHEMIQPGQYVQVEVIDDGVGIDLKNLSRIFDPFFTTKDHGSGTGLGLSTVYGIIKQTGGYITVESTLNVGTRFIVLLPKVDKPEITLEIATPEPASDLAFRDLTGSGTILLVEDEDAVRICSARALIDKGYTVIEAHNGYEALSHLKNIKNPEDVPHLLITDVIMPKMEGPQLAKEALKLYPNLRVIYVSGYAEEAFLAEHTHDEQIQFLPKPFSLKALAIKVREAFDQIENSPSEKSYPPHAENNNELRATHHAS